MEELTGLTHFSAGGNQATSLAPLQALQALRELRLPGNAVEAWDEVKHLAGHGELRVLDLSGASRAQSAGVGERALTCAPAPPLDAQTTPSPGRTITGRSC